jgi:hypothetical protein
MYRIDNYSALKSQQFFLWTKPPRNKYMRTAGIEGGLPNNLAVSDIQDILHDKACLPAKIINT